MALLTFMIPVISCKYTHHDIGYMLWEKNIAKVSSITLIPDSTDNKYNSAFITVLHESDINTSVKHHIESDDMYNTYTLEYNGECFPLLKVPGKPNPFRETNEFESKNIDTITETDLEKFTQRFSETHFTNCL